MRGSPLDAMIKSTVRCNSCGAKYGECDCAARRREDYIEREYQRLISLSDEDLIAECKSLGIDVNR
jgi:hypothetical protein